jgi:hypothetical protein
MARWWHGPGGLQTVIPAALALFVAGHGQQGSSGSRNTGSQTSGGLLLSVTPGILGSVVADLRGRGVEPGRGRPGARRPGRAHGRAAAAAPR